MAQSEGEGARVIPAESASPLVANLAPISNQSFFRRLLRRPLGVAGLTWIVIVVLIAIGAPIFAPHNPLATDLFHVLKGPNGTHLLGTDEDGRDVLSRLMYGARPALIDVVIATSVALVIGVPIGISSGYIGGRFDLMVRQITDMSLSFPTIIIVFIVLSVFSGNMFIGMLTLGILFSPGLIRIIRGSTLAIRNELYVEAARVAGLTRFQIMWRHILPRIKGPIIVQLSLLSAVSLVVSAGLAFLGIGAPPPNPTWGSMLNEGFSVIQEDAWLVIPTSGSIFLTCLAFGLVGDALRDTATETWIRPGNRSRRRPTTTSSAATPSPGSSSVELPAETATAAVSSDALLVVRDLDITFPIAGSSQGVTVASAISFDIAGGETVGVVGESGSGKTVVARAIIGLLASGGYVSRGQIFFEGKDLASLDQGEMRELRGRGFAYISQEPMVALDPAFSVGSLMIESIRNHDGVSRRDARARAIELLELVNMPDPRSVLRRYPHELSGGMAQRVSIARALAGRPKLLIADEPTTALDVTIQAEVLDLLRGLQAETGMAILLITHDWGVVADLAHRAVVLYAGQVVERATVTELFDSAAHPYSGALLASDPHGAATDARLPAIAGSVPSPSEWPLGCHFQARCSYATPECGMAPIELRSIGEGRSSRCIHTDLVLAKADQ
jgi:peptide/nickel transport system permease protein